MNSNNNIENRKDVVEFQNTEIGILDYIRLIHNCLLNENGSVKDEIEGDFALLKNFNHFSDAKDRVDFNIQLIQWLMFSDYITETSKYYIKKHTGSMRDTFKKMNFLTTKENISRTSNGLDGQIVNTNTCLSRLHADSKKIAEIIDKQIYNNIFCNESDDWVGYKKRFIRKVKDSDYIILKSDELLFDFRRDAMTSVHPKQDKFLNALDIMSKFTKNNMKNELNKIDKEVHGYIIYLASCNPQSRIDKDNYELLQKLINGTYETIDKFEEDNDNAGTETMNKQLEEKNRQIDKLAASLNYVMEQNQKNKWIADQIRGMVFNGWSKEKLKLIANHVKKEAKAEAIESETKAIESETKAIESETKAIDPNDIII